MKKTISIYIHWPFCLSKCPYCDFNSYAEKSVDENDLIKFYMKEIDHYQFILDGREIKTIYFGGGTPSLMMPSSINQIIEKLDKSATFADDIEITLEANPRAAETEKLKDFKQGGINRLSLGIQSFDDERLHYLGRHHSADDAKMALEKAITVFDRLSFDLIYGTPNQTLEEWQKELNQALRFNLKHVSLYQLTIEKGTVFYKKRVRELDEKKATIFFQTTNEIMAGSGIPAYEISNYAVPGEESRHNRRYWDYEDYLGIGAGAHSRFGDNARRTAVQNQKKPTKWKNKVVETGNGAEIKETLTLQQAQTEALFMGLRQTKGINLQKWKNKFNDDISAFLPEQRIKKLEKEGLIKQTLVTLSATPAGLQRLNAIVEFLL